jgi:DNA-binding HxlR family transcriptional regulator
MEYVGDAWAPLILRELYHGVTRYDDFQRNLGIARNTLSDRLNKLVDGGLLEKRLYQDNPPRNEYLLTDMGRDFFPVLAALAAWGDRWLDGGAGPPVSLHHTTCDRDLLIDAICTDCGESVSVEDIEFRVGPGYPKKPVVGAHLKARLAPASNQKARGRPKRRSRSQPVGRRAR